MADRCELCRYWETESSTSSKGECTRTGKVTRYDDEACSKYSR